MKRIKYLLLWFAVIPFSILAGLIVNFPLHWILFRTLSGGDSPFITPYPELPERILEPFFRALIIVWISSQIAPEHKFKTAMIFATIWIFVAGASFAIGYFGVNVGNTRLSLTTGGLPVVMGVIGAVAGLYIVKKNPDYQVESI